MLTAALHYPHTHRNSSNEHGRGITSHICWSEETDSFSGTAAPNFSGGRQQAKVVSHCVLPPGYDLHPCQSDITTSITQGRVICRLVSMFDSIDVLIDEGDRRRAIATDLIDSDEETPESVHLFIIINLTNIINSQSRIFQGYELLLQNIPKVEEKLLSMEVDELVVYLRDVSCSIYSL